MIQLVLCLNGVFCLLVVSYMMLQGRKVNKLKQAIHSIQGQAEQMHHYHPLLIHADLVFSKKMSQVSQQMTGFDKRLHLLETASMKSNDEGYQATITLLDRTPSNRDDLIKIV